MTPHCETDVADVAAAIGEPSRTRILLALAGGGALPASALAAEAGVAPSTVSGHLARLREARLVTVELDGRHRYYRLATTEVARTLEQLARIARPLPPRTLGADGRTRALMRARLCYDHLAGRLGVELMDALREADILTADRPGEKSENDGNGENGGNGGNAAVAYTVSSKGRTVLGEFGVDMTALSRRRSAVRYCVDWAERRHHLAGPLGGVLTTRLFELGWLRRGRYRRVVLLTDAGRTGLVETFGVAVERVDAAR
ncbi:helix-turn-helix transcriptional regulator [Streptomyces sp. TS71-3]|uniref:ArsR/SmtB family transcription factor n=1 Tax=Streptomyces sp. TS71-3 TaxID=2733862 RepID=UPI001B2DAE01|nr:helix-turn-helix domain-containing protein [Streptomyces sp. TS71-3]GHJ42373.1 transcriptional regulator [Streptomyces sp. TS71-3]